MFRLLLKKYFPVVMGGVVLFTAVGCQNFAVQSEEWKQTKIATLYQNYAQEFPQVEAIKVQKLQKLQQQGKELVLVDVRSPAEIAVSQLPGAITKQEFEQNIDQYQNATIVAYCTIGYRSGKYAQQARKKGVEILNLEGSLLAWSHIQGELINSTGNTNKVHVFGRQWQLTADDYQPVW